MLDQEGDLEADEQQPEVDLAQALVEHLACHLRPPEVQAGEEHEHDGAEHGVVEVGNDEVAVGDVEVQRRRRQDDAGQTTEEEGDQEAHGPEHWSVKGDRALPHGADPVEELHTCRHRNEHCHQGEEGQIDRAGDVHVVSPHRDRKSGDRHGREDQALVTEDRLAREHRDDLARDAEERQGEDVHLRMAEEPEQVLPEDRTAIGGIEHHRAVVTVDERDHEGGCQNRERDQHEDARDECCPGEDRHAEHRHARSAHAEDGGDEVDRTQDGAETAQGETQEPHVGADLWRVDRIAERRVGEPTEGCRATRGKEARCHDEAAEQEQPIAEHVQTREGDVRCADLQGHDHVREADEQRRRKEEQHDRAVHGEHLVVLLE